MFFQSQPLMLGLKLDVIERIRNHSVLLIISIPLINHYVVTENGNRSAESAFSHPTELKLRNHG